VRVLRARLLINESFGGVVRMMNVVTQRVQQYRWVLKQVGGFVVMVSTSMLRCGLPCTEVMHVRSTSALPCIQEIC